MAPRSSSPTTPSLMADPIDFTTPQSMPSQLKKAVTTHATQAKAILNNLKQSLSQDSDEQRAEERKKCAKVLKTIKKAEKKQAFDKKESMYRAALDFIEKQASGRPAPARANPPPGAALTVRGGAALRRRRSCRPSRTRCRRRRRSTSAGTRRAARTPRAS